MFSKRFIQTRREIKFIIILFTEIEKYLQSRNIEADITSLNMFHFEELSSAIVLTRQLLLLVDLPTSAANLLDDRVKADIF